MLYKLIIVEDEDDIRNGLSRIVNWNEMGFIVVNTFYSTQIALDYLENNPVDVVLTDICMKGLSGLDLAAWISQNRPDIHTLILSGYSDFKYAQAAIDYKVYKYLLKPTEPGEFRRIFKQLYDHLSETDRDQIRHRRSNQYCLKSFLRMMIDGEFDEQKISWFSLVALGKNNDVGWIACKMTCPHSDESIETLFYDTFEAHDAFCIVLVYSHSNLVILALPRNEEPLSDFARVFEHHVDKAVNTIRDLVGLKLTVINFDYSREYTGIKKVLSYQNYEREGKTYRSKQGTQISCAIQQIENMDTAKLKESLCQYSQEILQNIGFMLLARLQNGFKSSVEQWSTMEQECQRILDASDNELLLYIKDIIDRLETAGNYKTMDVVEKVCQYVDHHPDRPVTLRDAASHVYVSPAYLSRVFREKTGINFKTYTTAASIRHARKMLETTDMKIYEIADRLGYKDVRHFYAIFKKNTGMTPTQYRNNQGAARQE